MSFKIGQEVVCINDEFPAHVYAIYDKLVEKGKTYIVRDVVDGVVPIAVDPKTKGSFPIFHGPKMDTLYLDGVINKIDPVSRKEPGFAAFRFAPLNTEEEKVKESVRNYEPITA